MLSDCLKRQREEVGIPLISAFFGTKKIKKITFDLRRCVLFRLVLCDKAKVSTTSEELREEPEFFLHPFSVLCRN